jgi:hypothetical protein
MSKLKSYLLAFLLLGLVSSAQAAATKFKDLTVTGNLTVTGTTTHTGAVTNTAGTTTSGVITTSASTPYAISIASVTAAVPAGTPTAAGLIAFSTTYVMYVSTGTGAGAWVKVGSQ